MIDKNRHEYQKEDRRVGTTGLAIETSIESVRFETQQPWQQASKQL